MTTFSFLLCAGHLFYFLIHLRLLQGLNRLTRMTHVAPPDETDPKNPAKKVSVLISVRNEDKVIESCLNTLLAQDYPRDRLEIVLLNDRSDDRTGDIIRSYVDKHPKLFKVITISANENYSESPKKYALSKGLAAASGELILSTDADCLLPSGWVRSMASEFNEDTAMVLGLTTYYRDPKLPRWLWGTQSLEFFSHSVVSSSLVANGFPINANANNLAYRRSAAEAIGGFKSHSHIVSGDDDFLLQKIAAKDLGEIKFSLNSNSFVETRPSLTMGQIWEQRKRWASKCGFYGKKQVAFLSCIYAYYCGLLLFLLGGLFAPAFFWIGLGHWGAKTLMDYRVISRGMSLFNQGRLRKWFPAAAVIHIPLIVFAVLFGSFGNFTWKGQRVSKKLK